jgi:hypothetical protein
MKSKMASKFAFKNMKANALLLTPFLIASSIMGTLFFVMASLGQNQYIEKNHEYIAMLIQFGIFIVGIFTFIFILYANSFLAKRRNKEFALYGILGLEKKHIAKIISIEYILNFLTVSFFSITGGFVLGKLAFILLNRITKNMTAKIMDYNFSSSSAILTLIFLGIIFVLIYLTMVFKIGKSTPIELLSKQKKAEGEPKSKFILGTLGFIILCIGYYLSITSKGSIKSFGRFFPAVFAVIIGTYLVFIAFSILILKLLKRNRNLYYKAKHFLSISGMLYRMKSNAVSLASITLLSTSIIVTLSTTLTINSSIKDFTNSIHPKEFYLSSSVSGNNKDILENGEERKKEILNILNKVLKEDEKIKNLTVKKTITNPVINENGKITPLGKGREISSFLIIETLEDFNKNNNTNYTLKDDEVLCATNSKNLKNYDSLDFAGKNYKLVKVKDLYPKNISAEGLIIIVKDNETYIKMLEEYTPKYNDSNLKYYLEFYFDLDSADKEAFYTRLQTEYNIFVQQKDIYSHSLSSKAEVDAFAYELNGGLLFFGMIVALIFITGTVLITYYKQISEGFEDKQSYHIMKNVGLPDSIIKKSLRVQILWIFFLPLVIATIHSIFAFPILYNILGGLGFQNIRIFAMSFTTIVLGFSVIYFIIYSITSRVYYKIIK